MGKLADGILDLLFEPRCAFCRKRLRPGESGMCSNCADTLPFRCPPLIEPCTFVDVMCAPLPYKDDEVREALLRYKFGGKTVYSRLFGRLIAESVRECLTGKYDLISWVPLSEKRLRERGYDQAMLLALAAALELDDVAVETLRKNRNTAPQSGTESADERRANISGAYEVIDSELVRGKRILLIDDIITTGSTLSECARTLMLAGAEGVVCAAVAH